ncbi:MAG: hypothetical protein GY787_33555, partial [Alteromonadales bacterium]|nr:hypothetical protein [Alteromonadales bacterium]
QIIETASSGGSVDVIRFGPGISSAHVEIKRENNDLLLVHKNGVDQVRIVNWYLSSNNQIEQVLFSEQDLTATMEGDEITTRRTYPDIHTDYNSTPVITKVEAGVNDTFSIQSELIEVNLDPNQIKIDFNVTSSFGVPDGSYPFNGYTFTGFSNKIDNVTINSLLGPTIENIDFGDHHIYLYLSGPIDPASEIILDVTFAKEVSLDRTTLHMQGLEVHGDDGDNDIIGLNNQADYLYGEGGNDTLNGLGGNDKLYGGEGIDTIDGGKGENQLFGGEGDDTLSSHHGDSRDSVYIGGAGNDTITGGEHTDIYKFNIG